MCSCWQRWRSAFRSQTCTILDHKLSKWLLNVLFKHVYSLRSWLDAINEVRCCMHVTTFKCYFSYQDVDKEFSLKYRSTVGSKNNDVSEDEKQIRIYLWSVLYWWTLSYHLFFILLSCIKLMDVCRMANCIYQSSKDKWHCGEEGKLPFQEGALNLSV